MKLFIEIKIVKCQPNGLEIRKMREAKGMGLRQFAREAKCSPSYISRIENGKISFVSKRIAESVKRALESK